MSVTQEDADKKVQNIKDELAKNFGDIENVNLDEARAIRDYCKQKVKLYDISNTPVEYAYWFYLARTYDEAVSATIKYGNTK
jgi:hypothetical protein